MCEVEQKKKKTFINNLKVIRRGHLQRPSAVLISRLDCNFENVPISISFIYSVIMLSVTKKMHTTSINNSAYPDTSFDFS